MQASISPTVKITTSSGFILMPWVSSSKKRSRPALAAGTEAPFSRLLCLLLLVLLNGSFSETLYERGFSN